MIKFGGVVTAGVGAVVLSSGPGRTSPFARFTALVLEHLQPFDVVGVAEPELHPDERFSALDAEHVPRFRLRQELRDRTLRETENGFAEDLLTDVVGEQRFLDLGGDRLGVQVLR